MHNFHSDYFTKNSVMTMSEIIEIQIYSKVHDNIFRFKTASDAPQGQIFFKLNYFEREELFYI